MNGYFLPFNYTQTLYEQLYMLKQGTKLVDGSNTDDSYQLIAWNNSVNIDEQLVL